MNINQMKLDVIIKRQRLAANELNVDYLIAMAIEAEARANDLGPFDRAYNRFKQQQLDFEQAAACLELLNTTSPAMAA
ncbi:uncharacterized protein NMK_2150 [Novimethylophilus kurashikiensis]|uniref:Uncharacterized protein n=1 Tax=Novimethylophilus kurashikiensis TaxID=1825523 RepID=A0A2R5FCW5_9PROT|nr:hypothetical protein [Novimethylophilus kurashikiensis]GBG14551.1 uncharacterized protein NMK_2150 [Novimethylophilus kurashikiensis]